MSRTPSSWVRFPLFPFILAAGIVGFVYIAHDLIPPQWHSAPIVCTITAVLATVLVEYVRRQANRVHAAMAEVRSYVRRLEEEIGHRKRAEAQLVQAKEAAEEANRAKDRFLAAVSHELRTPLTAIMCLAEFWEGQEDLPDERRAELAILRQSVDLETRLIEDLLDWSRIANGKLSVRPQRVDIQMLIEQTVMLCRCAADARSVAIRTQAPGPTHLEGDPVRLTQILWNLVNNAVKFSSPGGLVTVRCSAGTQQASADAPAGAYVRMEVTDQGKGIAPELLPRIFIPFEQGGAAVTRHFGGLGLGLAITKALVEAHDGRITAFSEGEGLGATFTVELPLDISLNSPQPKNDPPTDVAAPSPTRLLAPATPES